MRRHCDESLIRRPKGATPRDICTIPQGVPQPDGHQDKLLDKYAIIATAGDWHSSSVSRCPIVFEAKNQSAFDGVTSFSFPFCPPGDYRAKPFHNALMKVLGGVVKI